MLFKTIGSGFSAHLLVILPTGNLESMEKRGSYSKWSTLQTLREHHDSMMFRLKQESIV